VNPYPDSEAGLLGPDAEEGIVAVEHDEGDEDGVVILTRDARALRTRREHFRPFVVAAGSALKGLPPGSERTGLDGGGALDTLVSFRNWTDCRAASRAIADATGVNPGAPNAPCLFLNDPVHQYLLVSGKTLFRGMSFADVSRMQVDIECRTTPGYDFCNAEREGDSIIAIGLGDNTGWSETISASEMSETDILKRFVAAVKERDPDVIEGHNIFNFDLPYIAARAKRHRVKLALGRDGSSPKARPSRFSAGERTISYTRFEIWGRHIIDTLFLVHAYDVTHRSLPGFGLKEVARHFGVASSGRTYLDASRIGAEFDRDPEKVMAYLRDDVQETRDVASLLSRSVFAQAGLLPYSYQNTCVRGNATKIDAMMLRRYLAARRSLPFPDTPRPFAGGYTDMFVTGLVRNVHHCDVRSLYPSLMITRNLVPRSDSLGVFADLLASLRRFRLDAKRRMQQSNDQAERLNYDALQTAFKVLINSFYGYLGCAQARFCDFSAAEEVTRQGRELLGDMIARLRKHGAVPVEIDTDGIYFVPPAGPGGKGNVSGEQIERFRSEFAASLPSGIDVEFDGEYESMFSYKMKNYALLGLDGEVTIRGAALKSRGLEQFQRAFLREMLQLRLLGRDVELPELKSRFERAIRDGEWTVEAFAKTEILQDSPATYAAKLERGGRARSAVYELALKSGRDYRPGDSISYYVTGDRKNVKLFENARLASEWDAGNRDENVNYYLAKLDALWARFCEGDTGQGELDLQPDTGGDG
jgi:DNA polymerase elongation subunit (family B)